MGNLKTSYPLTQITRTYSCKRFISETYQLKSHTIGLLSIQIEKYKTLMLHVVIAITLPIYFIHIFSDLTDADKIFCFKVFFWEGGYQISEL